MTEFDDYVEVVRKKFEHNNNLLKDDVLKLAKLAERDDVPKNEIARLIAHVLQEVTSRAWIYRVLPDEYKIETKPKKKDSTVESLETVKATSQHELTQSDGTVLLNKQGDDLTEEEHKPDQNNTPANTIHATNVEKIDKSQSLNNENKIINPKQLAEAIKEAIISSMKESNIQVVDLDPVQCIRCKYPQYVKVNSMGRMVLD